MYGTENLKGEMGESRLVAIDANKENEITKIIVKNMGYLQAMQEYVVEDKLTGEMKKSLLSLMEGSFTDVAKLLDYDSVLVEEEDERYKEIRRLNLRNQELEKMVGDKNPVVGLLQTNQRVEKEVKKWWKGEGFNHVTELAIYPFGGLHVEFSFMINSRGGFLSTDTSTLSRGLDEHVDHLEKMGFTFIKDTQGEHTFHELKDTDTNRKLLMAMLTKRFQSIDIQTITNRRYKQTDEFYITGVGVMIRDMEDVFRSSDEG